jgi:hypothetical protein
VSGRLRVVVAWLDTTPGKAALAEVARDLGVKPELLPLREKEPNAWQTRRAAARTRRAALGLRVGRKLVRTRGGTRPGRWLINVTKEPRQLTVTQLRALRIREGVAGTRPVLLVAMDASAAAYAWALRPDHPHVLAVNGLATAARVGQAVLDSGRPWEEWPDVVGDVTPSHLYAALPGLVDGSVLPQHELDEPRAAVPAPPLTGSQPRLLTGPANYAGQGAAWVRAVETHLGVPAANVAVARSGTAFSFAADHPVTQEEWELTAVRRRLALEAVGPSTHVLVESLRPLLDCDGEAASGWDFAAGAADVRALIASGRKVGVLLHGSETRRPARHAELYPHSPFAGLPASAAGLVAATDLVHELLAGLTGVPVFASTPDLLDFVPSATWVPTVVRRDAFEPGTPVLQGNLPVFLHAPSNPLLKGSDVVDDVLGRLQDEGLLEYRRLTDVPPPLVAHHVRQADVVVDQIALGNLGVMGLEAMACGRAVLGHAIPTVLERYGELVPLGLVDPVGLEQQVRDLLADPARVVELATAGPDFVRRHHDGRRSAEALREFLAG